MALIEACALFVENCSQMQSQMQADKAFGQSLITGAKESASECVDERGDLSADECLEAYMVLQCVWNAVEAALAAGSGRRVELECAVTEAFRAAEQAPTSQQGVLGMVQDLALEIQAVSGSGPPTTGNVSSPLGTAGTATLQAFVQSLKTSRNIVCCLDGTWNHIDSTIPEFTNVHRIFQEASCPSQIKNYLPGVGVHQGLLYKWLYGMTGKGVFRTARLAWEFIAQNYLPGDNIFIFGFSRGAYAARHLAGMIARCGLDGVRETEFQNYLKLLGLPNRCPKQEVHFLGLFDCVPGNQLYTWLPRNRRMNLDVLENGIIHFRHAVSTLERRWSFKPIVFRPEDPRHQSFIQRWFPGYHSDVGGGHGISHELASFSLWWMVREAFTQGLKFKCVGDCSTHPRRPVSTYFKNAKPDATPKCSDWWTTRLGLRWDRCKLKANPLLGQPLAISDLQVCPECKHPW